MDNGKRPWACPWCGQSFLIPAHKRDPEICPECRDTAAANSDRFSAAKHSVPAAVSTFRTLRPCRYCGHLVAHNAERCPSCDGTAPYPTGRGLYVMGCAAMLAFSALFASCMMLFDHGREPDHRRDEIGWEHVTRDEFGAGWPLIVDSGYVGCIDGFRAVFRTEQGTIYGLNGPGMQLYPEIDVIWKDDPKWAGMPEMAGVKINIGPLLDRARALCRRSG